MGDQGEWGTLATYRCQDATNRLTIGFRVTEGAPAVLQAYVVPAIAPKACSIISYRWGVRAGGRLAGAAAHPHILQALGRVAEACAMLSVLQLRQWQWQWLCMVQGVQVWPYKPLLLPRRLPPLCLHQRESLDVVALAAQQGAHGGVDAPFSELTVTGGRGGVGLVMPPSRTSLRGGSPLASARMYILVRACPHLTYHKCPPIHPLPQARSRCKRCTPGRPPACQTCRRTPPAAAAAAAAARRATASGAATQAASWAAAWPAVARALSGARDKPGVVSDRHTISTPIQLVALVIGHILQDQLPPFHIVRSDNISTLALLHGDIMRAAAADKERGRGRGLLHIYRPARHDFVA